MVCKVLVIYPVIHPVSSQWFLEPAPPFQRFFCQNVDIRTLDEHARRTLAC